MMTIMVGIGLSELDDNDNDNHNDDYNDDGGNQLIGIGSALSSKADPQMMRKAAATGGERY